MQKMEINFTELKKKLKGEWKGEGFAKFPTIEDTDYTEAWSFTPDDDKDSIYYNQRTWYKSDKKKKWANCFLGYWFHIAERE